MKTLVVIPARFASTRFPGKPLAKIGVKPMIQWVYERVKSCSVVDRVVVATDDKRIVKAVEAFGGEVKMTNPKHPSGTDRCAEVVGLLADKFDIVVNVQGDEPFIDVQALEQLIQYFLSENPCSIATLKHAITDENELISPNKVKVVSDLSGKALYFSRMPLPYFKELEITNWLEKSAYFKHIGVYAFQTEALAQVAQLKESPAETAEKLEQLRWLQNGFSIQVIETNYETIAVDTPEDLEEAIAFAKANDLLQ